MGRLRRGKVSGASGSGIAAAAQTSSQAPGGLRPPSYAHVSALVTGNQSVN